MRRPWTPRGRPRQQRVTKEAQSSEAVADGTVDEGMGERGRQARGAAGEIVEGAQGSQDVAER